MGGSFVFVMDALQHSATNALPYVYALQHCHEKSASVSLSLWRSFFFVSVFCVSLLVWRFALAPYSGNASCVSYWGKVWELALQHSSITNMA